MVSLHKLFSSKNILLFKDDYCILFPQLIDHAVNEQRAPFEGIHTSQYILLSEIKLLLFWML